MKKGIRWGILGPGKIAITFAEAVNLIGEDVIVAVASHDERKAAAFAAEHQIAHGYGSYEELVSRDDIDAVYVSNLHMMHREMCIRDRLMEVFEEKEQMLSMVHSSLSGKSPMSITIGTENTMEELQDCSIDVYKRQGM